MHQKIIFAAIKRNPPGTYPPERPDRAYELLTVGVANNPIEDDRPLRHRLFTKYGEVPDCLILEEVELGQDWTRIKRGWKDAFDIFLVWKPGSDDGPVRAQRLGKWWADLLAAHRLVPGNAEPRLGATVRLEIAAGAPHHAFLERLARDGLEINYLETKPGRPLTVGLSGGTAVVAQFLADLSREGGLLPAAPSL